MTISPAVRWLGITVIAALFVAAGCQSRSSRPLPAIPSRVHFKADGQHIKWTAAAAFSVSFIGPKPCDLTRIESAGLFGWECSHAATGMYLYMIGEEVQSIVAPRHPALGPSEPTMVRIDPCRHSCDAVLGHARGSEALLAEPGKPSPPPVALYLENGAAKALPTTQSLQPRQAIEWQGLGDQLSEWTVTFDSNQNPCTNGVEFKSKQGPCIIGSKSGIYSYKFTVIPENGDTLEGAAQLSVHR